MGGSSSRFHFFQKFEPRIIDKRDFEYECDAKLEELEKGYVQSVEWDLKVSSEDPDIDDLDPDCDPDNDHWGPDCDPDNDHWGPDCDPDMEDWDPNVQPEDFPRPHKDDDKYTAWRTALEKCRTARILIGVGSAESPWAYHECLEAVQDWKLE
jgi:hypothetical protein